MRAALVVVAATVLGGCSLAPPYERPIPPVPVSWPVGDPYLLSQEAALPAVSYRTVFLDARLQTLIEQALVNNRDLAIAAANIEAARAQFRIQRGNQFPQIDATGRFTYSGGGSGATTTPGTGGGGTTDPSDGTDGGTGGGTVVTRSVSRTSYAADLGTTAFELDLFGRLRSLTEAERNRLFATEAAARTVRLALVGDIADAWLRYAADRSLLTIAQQTVASSERSVSLTRARLEGGIAPRTDLRQAEQVLATAQSDLAEQRTLLAQEVNLLRQLVGAEVDPALLPTAIEEAAPTIAQLPAGLDSSVLLRRPDIVQSEYELRAANAEIGAARAALFPRLTLTGLLGFASDALGSLFTGDAFSYSAAAGLSYPIFRAGAGRAGVAFTEAQRAAQLAAYQRAIQIGFREVADGLARAGTIEEQLAADRRNLDAAADTFRLTDARYRGGIDTFLTSLDAQRSLYVAQRTLVASQLIGAGNRVTLYQALGGDATLEPTVRGPIPTAIEPVVVPLR